MAIIFDLFLIPVAYLYVFGIIFMASKWKSNGKIDGPLARKVVHLGIGILVIVAPLLFSTNIVPTMIGLSFVAITYLTSPISPRQEWRLAAFRDGHGFGTVYYSLSLTILIFLFFDHGWIIQVGFLPLVFGDAFANIIGRQFGNHHLFGLSKSIEGSLGGFVASVIIVFSSLSLYLGIGQFPGNQIMIISIAVWSSLIMMIVEFISPFGLDNLTIPLGCTIFILIYYNAVILESCFGIICS